MCCISRIVEGSSLGRIFSFIEASGVNSVFLSASLVEKMRGLKMNKLNRIGPIMGILEGQQWVSSGSCVCRAVRLSQYFLYIIFFQKWVKRKNSSLFVNRVNHDCMKTWLPLYDVSVLPEQTLISVFSSCLFLSFAVCCLPSRLILPMLRYLQGPDRVLWL